MARPNFKELRALQTQKAKNGTAYKTSNDTKSYVDERFWKIGKDSDGNGEATIRLIPSLAKDKESLNTFIIRPTHSINTIRPGTDGKDKNDARWRSFLCAGDDCPVCKTAWSKYNTAKDNNEDKDKVLKPILQAWTSKDEIITNILVVDDPINPDNNGKVFLYEMKNSVLELCDKEATRINKIIEKAEVYKDADPEKYEEILADEFISKDVTTFDAYDLFSDGKNIDLVFINKKDSRWGKPADYWGSTKIATRFKPAIKSEEEFEELMEKAYCLDEFVDPNNFEGAKKKIMSNEMLQDEIDFLEFKIDDISKVRKDRRTGTKSSETTKPKPEVKSEEPKEKSAQEKALEKMKMKKEVEKVEEVQEPEVTKPDEVETPTERTEEVDDKYAGMTDEEREMAMLFDD